MRHINVHVDDNKSIIIKFYYFKILLEIIFNNNYPPPNAEPGKIKPKVKLGSYKDEDIEVKVRKGKSNHQLSNSIGTTIL